MSNFRFLKGPGPTAIWIDSERVNACMEFYRENNLTRVAISPQMGFKLSDLDFLESHRYVRGVEIPDGSGIDLGGLRSLERLEYLLLSNSREPLDVSGFQQLEELRVECHSGLRLSNECTKLRTLHLRKFKSPSRSLEEIPELPALEDFSIVQSPIESIRGVGRFPLLRRLELSYLTKLSSISAISELSGTNLEVLDCKACKKIADHEAVAGVLSLRTLKLNDCGEIRDLSFLASMRNLEEFRFVGTKILDGDLTPLLALKRVGFSKMRHYSHTPQGIRSAIGDN